VKGRKEMEKIRHEGGKKKNEQGGERCAGGR
jgi:hypothetical protein